MAIVTLVYCQQFGIGGTQLTQDGVSAGCLDVFYESTFHPRIACGQNS